MAQHHEKDFSRRVRTFLLTGLFGFLLAGCAADDDSGGDSGDSSTSINGECTLLESVNVEMDDGVSLYTEIYGDTFDPSPVVLVRTPYGIDAAVSQLCNWYSDFGFTLVVQETRGRGRSEGEDRVFLTDGDDGRATLRWLEESGYSNGVVGSWGASALAITQILMAPSASESYQCQEIIFGTDDGYEVIWPGGARRIDIDEWARDQGSEHIIAEWDAHPEESDPYWDGFRIAEEDYANVNTRGLHVAGWFDVFLQGTLNWYMGLQNEGGSKARGKQRLVVGPWTHNFQSGELDYSAAFFSSSLLETQSQFTENCYLNTTDDESLPNVQLYVMGAAGETGAPGNEWVDFDSWPPASTNHLLYLSNDGTLLEELPAGAESPVTYSHDPLDPVPTVGGHNLTIDAGPYDQTAIENRPEVAVFTGDPLNEPLRVIGKLNAVIYLETDAELVDVVVRLTDVYPDGRSMLIAEGVRRVSGAGIGMVQTVELDLRSTALVFNAGHRIRVSVAGASFGAYDSVADAADASVHVSSTNPSHVVLPRMP